MDAYVNEQTSDWKNTKEAVANFRRLLLCSKCSELMKEPVCLGMCEHVLCRSCAGPQAGDGCVVCHRPAWVKDIQINRQLSSIIQVFSNLESLLKPTEQPDCSPDNTKAEPEHSVFKQKKNLKIWFSPRSRKVRCLVETPSEVTSPESGSKRGAGPAMSANNSAQPGDMSIFNFTSSSQDSGSSSSPNSKNKSSNKKRSAKKNASSRDMVQCASRSRRKPTKETMKKNKLEAINQRWGITGETDSPNKKGQACVEGVRRSTKRVSFLSPVVTSDDPQLEVPQASNNDHRPDTDTVKGNLSENNSVLNEQTQSSQNISPSVIRSEAPSVICPSFGDSPAKRDYVSPLKRPSETCKADGKVTTLESTPKRPRVSPARGRKSQISPTVLNPPSSDSPGCDKKKIYSGRQQCQSPPVHRSPLSQRSASGSPAVLKRNHKGETPLHIASIKGDAEAVKELLDQGADPNMKDNAGWTPLHEACNLGHLGVVEVLVSGGALLNTPGYENDSPLHDAVRNGQLAIAQLLLQLGASANVLNLYGKRPADYAASLEMREIFQNASDGMATSLSPSASLSVVSGSVRREEIVLLATRLSQPEQQQLVRLGKLLGGRVADTFSASVSHIVVPEGQMCTTLSTLSGLLAGCWVVKHSWVKTCLQAGKWMPEAEHEAGEGPQRSRINRCSLLPPLFDGCFFFLLGSFKSPSKDELARLLREGGGQLLSRRPKPDSDVTQTVSAAAYHAPPGSDQALCTQYVVFDPRGRHRPAVGRRGKVWSAPSTWIINCIAAFSLLPVPDPQTLD
eukprot:XP_003962054.1 PREDICTED: BRCA1-associated RING domain protein 1 [Takifugu rubripes]